MNFHTPKIQVREACRRSFGKFNNRLS